MEWIIPTLILLACPVMMLLMMRRGGHTHGTHGRGSDPIAGMRPGQHHLDAFGGMSDEQLNELVYRAKAELEDRSARRI